MGGNEHIFPDEHVEQMSQQELASKTKEELLELVLKLQADLNAKQGAKKRKLNQIDNSPEKPVSYSYSTVRNS